MGNDKQTEAWMKGFEAGRDNVFEFLKEELNKDIVELKRYYKEWCNTDRL